jgi:mycothiol synthase
VPLQVWTHGRRSPLAPVLEARGYRRARTLHQLLLPSTDGIDEPTPAPGVTLRSFVPGRDEDAWLALNAAAFAHHPEQGRWTHGDLAARMAEDWFDPAGFLLAERDGALVGFHWTKVHPDGRGEVYVLGVDPAAQGLGLGATLLLAGLRHLAARGCPSVLLYVDDDNRGALHLYERYGFVRHDVDIQWIRPI